MQRSSKSALRRLVGRVGPMIRPSLRKNLNDGAYFSGTALPGRLTRWAAEAEFHRLMSEGRTQDIETALSRRWMDDNLADEYYDHFASRFETLFSGPHGIVLDWLDRLQAERPISKLVEVGCGDGKALALAAARIPGIASFLGIDINGRIIARNRHDYADRRHLSFYAGDATDWLERYCAPGALLMSIGGVMEYFAPETLSRWFSLIVERRGAGVLLVEPVDRDHDLANQPGSHLYGSEQSFSHNHAALLNAAGLEIRHRKENIAAGSRWIMALATLPGATPRAH